MYKIETNIPVPHLIRDGATKKFIAKLKAGDSFVVPSRSKYHTITQCIRSLELKYTSRKIENGQHRIWIIENAGKAKK